jgi:hypothetical protein
MDRQPLRNQDPVIDSDMVATSRFLPNTSGATKWLVVGITLLMLLLVIGGTVVAVLFSFGIVDSSSPPKDYVSSITSARMFQHLQQFQNIAQQHNNSRAVRLVLLSSDNFPHPHHAALSA